MTADQQWNRELFTATQVPMMDTTMRPDYSEDVIIGQAIIDQYFSKARLNTKPPIVAQLDEIHSTNELRLRNNEDEQEKNHMESIMDNILVQPWWQYEDE
eukprot:2026003-Amphidinium_carterae.1